MKRALRGWFTYANVAATLALLFAVSSGVVVAADGLTKNSVKSKQVKDDSLKSRDLKDGKGVTGADVAPNSLGGPQIDESTLGQVARAAAADDANTLAGKPASAFLGSDVVLRINTFPNVGPGAAVAETVQCKPGEKALGGGGTFRNVTSNANHVYVSTPIVGDDAYPSTDGATPTGWKYGAENGTGQARDLLVYAICAS